MMRYIPVGIITIAIIGGIWRISQLPDLNVSTPVPTNSEANSDWQGSAHNDETAQAFNSWNDLDPREIPVACARCHSTQGFLDFLGFDRSSKGIVDNPVPAPAGTIACQACHIDNDGSGIHTINEVTFPSGAIVSFGSDDASNICINCHQGRTSKISVDQYINEFNAASEPDLVQTSMTFQNIHYFAAGATLFGTNVKGAYEYDGKTYLGFTPDHRDIRCLDCHDGHSLKIKVEYCQDCHEQISDLRAIRLSVIDYDGHGNITKGIDSEINTLTEDLFIEIQNYAKSHGGAIIYENAVYPFFFDLNGEMYTAWTPRLLKASYNYQVVQKDPGAFSHNPRYIIQLLYDSIQDLGGDTSRFIRP